MEFNPQKTPSRTKFAHLLRAELPPDRIAITLYRNGRGASAWIEGNKVKIVLQFLKKTLGEDFKDFL